MIKLVFLIFCLQSGGEINLDKNGVAITGYDPVAYFSQKAVLGSPSLQVKSSGATYYFSSPENQQKFIQNPDKYLPQYGGWCAYALGIAPDKVKIDPETFKIVNGKLYLFYNFKGVNTLDLWNNDEEKLNRIADKNWNLLLGK